MTVSSELTVKDRVIRIIEADYEGVDVKPESDLRRDLGMDSFDHIEFLMELEDEFEMDIPDTDATALGTVAGTIDYISSRLSEGGRCGGR